jgi:hypothetical protein
VKQKKGDKKISEEKESPMKLLTTSMHDAEILWTLEVKSSKMNLGNNFLEKFGYIG